MDGMTLKSSCVLVIEIRSVDQIPRLNKSNQFMLDFRLERSDGSEIMTIRGARLTSDIDYLLPVTSGERNQYITTRYAPSFQENVLSWARKVLRDAGWTIAEIRNRMRGR